MLRVVPKLCLRPHLRNIDSDFVLFKQCFSVNKWDYGVFLSFCISSSHSIPRIILTPVIFYTSWNNQFTLPVFSLRFSSHSIDVSIIRLVFSRSHLLPLTARRTFTRQLFALRFVLFGNAP